MTKTSKMDFEFEFPDEDSDEVITERTVELVMEELQDSHTIPEISTKETDPFVLAVMELAEKARQDMIACAYNVSRSGFLKRTWITHPTDPEKHFAKIFMIAYGEGMPKTGWAIGLSPADMAEARAMQHCM